MIAQCHQFFREIIGFCDCHNPFILSVDFLPNGIFLCFYDYGIIKSINQQETHQDSNIYLFMLCFLKNTHFDTFWLMKCRNRAIYLNNAMKEGRLWGDAQNCFVGKPHSFHSLLHTPGLKHLHFLCCAIWRILILACFNLMKCRNRLMFPNYCD